MERSFSKAVDWIADSRDVVREFPRDVRLAIGVELDNIQQGLSPSSWKPMKTIGLGVNELRIKHGDQYRVLYVAKYEEAIYVLHAFKKKTQKTSKKDLELAAARFRSLVSWRSSHV
jgi:phage-related protein